jgi:hypothetical protein
VAALQRAAGNRAVAQLLAHSGTVTVQRATRDELLVALRAATKAGDWQQVATRLNGFDEADITRLSGELSLGEAANTRAAVGVHLAGWPQQPVIIAALDRGRPEVARIGKIYQAYQESIRDGDWAGAIRQLHAMSNADIDERLGKLPVDSLRAVCAVAPEQSERIAPMALATAKARGVEIPDGIGPLKIGDRSLGGTREYLPSGVEMLVEAAAPVAQGNGASIGARRIADGSVTLAGVVPAAAALAAPSPLPEGPSSGPESGIRRIIPGPRTPISPSGPGGAVAREGAKRVVGLGIRVPVIGVAFVAGLVGPYAAGWAIAHAAEVDKKLGEFGGTSAPGGAPLSGGTAPNTGPQPAPHKDEDGDENECTKCPPGTTAIYGNLDALGRATGVSATLRGRTWSGQRPQEDPAGFVSGVSGKFGGQHRAHLLARTLGGSGSAENLVPFGGPENIAMYNAVEEHVERHVTFHPTHCVGFNSVPTYAGSILAPTHIFVFARDLCTNEVIVSERVPNRSMH